MYDVNGNIGYTLFVVDLKKVTADMQTHKNTALRAGPAPFKAPAATAAPVKAPAAVKAVEKAPVFQQDGKKWIVVSGFVNLCSSL